MIVYSLLHWPLFEKVRPGIEASESLTFIIQLRALPHYLYLPPSHTPAESITSLPLSTPLTHTSREHYLITSIYPPHTHQLRALPHYLYLPPSHTPAESITSLPLSTPLTHTSWEHYFITSIYPPHTHQQRALLHYLYLPPPSHTCRVYHSRKWYNPRGSGPLRVLALLLFWLFCSPCYGCFKCSAKLITICFFCCVAVCCGYDDS